MFLLKWNCGPRFNDQHHRAAASAARIQNKPDPQLRCMQWLDFTHFLFKVVT